MARKTGNRRAYKDSESQNKNHESFPDDITLRDEILELKRQVMVLKRTNEQYLVKLRKHEDEAKRKDKQLEQMMDPRKNVGVTKVLSTKGAAILMNLKDQNDALIQMNLNKDQHIRRLVAEIKMSKLYASTRKNESYRAEINRLRNLLTKSEEMLKENIDFQQRTKSIYVSQNPTSEYSSSDQSSPRDLDELRVTILSLESHIKQSNDIMAKKNQEILHLTEEVNFLKKFVHWKTFKKTEAFDCVPTESKDEFIKTDLESTGLKPMSSTKTPNHQRVLYSPEKNENDFVENIPHCGTVVSTCDSSINTTFKYSFPLLINSQNTENQTEEAEPETAIPYETTKKDKSQQALGKSLFHNLAVSETKKDKIHLKPSTSSCTKVRWKKALNKYRELKKLNPQMFTDHLQIRKDHIMNNKIQMESPRETLEREKLENQRTLDDIPEVLNGLKETCITPKNGNEKTNCQVTPETQNSGEILHVNKDFSEEKLATKTEAVDNQGLQNMWLQTCLGKEKELSGQLPKPSDLQETESRTKCFREFFRQSSDSSYDSASSYSMKQVQVVVQINSVSPQSDSDQSRNSFSESNQILESAKENGGNNAPDLGFNDDDDDDDVIVRENR